MRILVSLAAALALAAVNAGSASASSLLVQPAIQGAGSVVDVYSGARCDQKPPVSDRQVLDCPAYTHEDTVAARGRLVAATGNAGWQFDRWSGCDDTNGTECSFSLPAAGQRRVYPRAIFKDIAAPSVIAFTVLPTGTSEGRYTATWGADELDVSFKCAIDNGAAAPCASGYTFSLAEGKHSVRVIPEDRSGNSGAMAEVKLNVVDTVFDESPAEGAYVATWRFAGHTGVGTAMECSLDAGVWFACGGASGPLTLPALADGQHTLRVRGVLNGTVDRYPAIRTWVVDTTAPDTTFNDYRITANEPVAGFRCRLDGADVACSTILPSTPGTHTFEVVAFDHAGNVDPTPATHTWTVPVLEAQTVFVPTQVEVPAAEMATPLGLHYSYSRGRLTRLDVSGPAGFKLTVKKPGKRATATTVATLVGKKLARGTKITVRSGAQAKTVTLR